MRGLSLHLILLSVVAAACSDVDPACRVGADCASGICLGDGTCSVKTVEPPTGLPPAWLEPTTPPYQPGSLLALECSPDLDGRITAAEMRPTVGIPVNFLLSGRGPVDVAGQAQAGGARRWDWTQAVSTEIGADFAAQPVSAQWYAALFSGAQFVLAFDGEDELDAVYSSDGETLWLHGLASVSAAPATQTLLVYERPVAVFRFPLALGAAWTSVGTVRTCPAGVLCDYAGKINGMPYAGQDTYEVRVDALGELALPSLVFPQVLRVRTKVTTDPSAGATIIRQQVSFVTECFGEVARAVSLDGETREDFTTAAELRRIGL